MNKINSILLFLVIVLALLVFYAPSSTPKNKVQILTRLSKDQIQQIHIMRKSLPEIQLKKIQGDWQLISTQNQPANPEMISKILDLLTTRSYQHFSSVNKKLNRYGLEQADTIIRFNEMEISFGNEEPLHGHRYILFKQQIHLINNYYYYLLRSPITKLIHEKETAQHPNG